MSVTGYNLFQKVQSNEETRIDGTKKYRNDGISGLTESVKPINTTNHLFADFILMPFAKGTA